MRCEEMAAVGGGTIIFLTNEHQIGQVCGATQEGATRTHMYISRPTGQTWTCTSYTMCMTDCDKNMLYY
jgi:hypothetical protein